jgi:hypothetical protein
MISPIKKIYLNTLFIYNKQYCKKSMTTIKNDIDEIYKDLDNFKQIPYASDYLISKYGLVYNTKNNKFKKPGFHKNGNFYYVHLKIKPRQNQIKHLLYITFIDPNFNLKELKNNL